MNSTDRVKYSTVRNVCGLDVRVDSIETFSYQGEWEPNGFNVHLGFKKIGFFYGYPSDSDLKKVIQKEVGG